jgi:hypothetical protein
MLLPPSAGNFIYARWAEPGRWVPILIAEGDAAERAALERMQAERLESREATHIHFHANPEPAMRQAEERDLLDRFEDAPCSA